MSLRMFEPETARLELADGEWLLVKKRLTAGEERRIQARANTTFVEGRIVFDQLKAGPAMIVEYLLDWSATDPQGKPLVIRDQPPEVVETVLNSLPGEAVREIQDAIFAHTARVRAELEDQKKMVAGSSAPDRTYASVS